MDQSVAIQDLLLWMWAWIRRRPRPASPWARRQYRAGCALLGDKLLCGKALDDRACFAILLDALGRLRDGSWTWPWSWLRPGGDPQHRSHRRRIRDPPDCCVAVDVTHGDSPDASKDKTFLWEAARSSVWGPTAPAGWPGGWSGEQEELGLDVQLEVMAGSCGTNGWPMQISREGIATAVLSLPLRYMHTPMDAGPPDNLDHTAQLLAAFLEGLGEEAEH